MTHTSFRFRLSYRLLVLTLFGGVLTFAGWVGLETVRILSIALEPISILFMAFWVFLMIVSVALGGVCLYYWTYRLEFGETSLQTRAIYHPILRSVLRPSCYAPMIHLFSCKYDDIVRVQRGEMRGILAIVLRSGRTIRIGSGWFDGSKNRLLDELARHISVERIEPGLADALWKRTRADLLRIISTIPVVLVFGIFLTLPTADLIARGQTGWHSVARVSPLSVKGFSLDSDGAPWLIAGTGTGSQYRVYHVSEAGTRVWKPPLRVNGREYSRPLAVGGNASGEPWIIFPTQMLHWTGAEWQQTPFPGGKIQNRYDKMAVAGSNLWALALTAEGSDEVLWSMDFSSGESHVVLLPNSAVQAGLSVYRFHVLTDESLLVFAGGSGDIQGVFYLLRDGQWQMLGYPAEWSSSGVVQDLTMDSIGRVWVLYRIYGGDRVVGDTLSRLDPESMAWAWWQLEPQGSWTYWSMEVDTLGRIWLADSDSGSLAVFQLTSDDRLYEIVRYTPENSNYEYGPFRLGPDGRMWSLGDRLVWIDSNVATLPRPLPDSMVIAVNRSAQPRWILLFFAALGIREALAWRLRRY